MDPKALVNDWINGTGAHYGSHYRDWIDRGGFPARVEVHPGTDAWMQGDRYGEIVKLGTKYAHIRMDRSGRLLRFSRHWIGRVL